MRGAWTMYNKVTIKWLLFQKGYDIPVSVRQMYGVTLVNENDSSAQEVNDGQEISLRQYCSQHYNRSFGKINKNDSKFIKCVVPTGCRIIKELDQDHFAHSLVVTIRSYDDFRIIAVRILKQSKINTRMLAAQDCSSSDVHFRAGTFLE